MNSGVAPSSLAWFTSAPAASSAATSAARPSAAAPCSESRTMLRVSSQCASRRHLRARELPVAPTAYIVAMLLRNFTPLARRSLRAAPLARRLLSTALADGGGDDFRPPAQRKASVRES